MSSVTLRPLDSTAGFRQFISPFRPQRVLAAADSY
jgi:hypothetical protein